MHHNISITYQPKKDKVFNQTCKQTLRLHSKVRRGDGLTLFEWSGKPRHSPWGRRLDAVCKVSIPVEVFWNGVQFPDDMIIVSHVNQPAEEGQLLPMSGFFLPWVSVTMDHLAEADGIDPPTGVEWFEVMKKLHPKADWKHGEESRLIRWS